MVATMPRAATTEDARAAQLEAMLLHHEIETFNTRYAATLDEQRLDDWIGMFTDDAL